MSGISVNVIRKCIPYFQKYWLDQSSNPAQASRTFLGRPPRGEAVVSAEKRYGYRIMDTQKVEIIILQKKVRVDTGEWTSLRRDARRGQTTRRYIFSGYAHTLCSRESRGPDGDMTR